MSLAVRLWRRFAADPRHGQIATLGTLLVYGMARLGFDLTLAQAAVTIGAALAAQVAGDRIVAGRVTAGVKSALISALSLCLLLRTDALWLAALGSALAVGSKFLVRVGGKHVFNPTNIALVVLMIVTDAVWVSPGQWGTGAALAFFLACAGLLVVNRAARADVTLAFMCGYGGLLLARSLWLGEPMTIPVHRLESGAFLLFSFFMISDPKTTPDSRPARILFALLVAFVAWYVQFRLFRTNGFLWALAAASPLVPLLDLVARGPKYQWPAYQGSGIRPQAPEVNQAPGLRLQAENRPRWSPSAPALPSVAARRRDSSPPRGRSDRSSIPPESRQPEGVPGEVTSIATMGLETQPSPGVSAQAPALGPIH